MNLINDSELKSHIVNRLKELDYKQAFICKDAEERGMKIDPSRLSKYIKGKKSGLTEEQLLWIATRLGIYVNVGFGKLHIENGKPSYKLTPYSELEAIKMLNKIFSEKRQKVDSE
jgi:hypothetical protein